MIVSILFIIYEVFFQRSSQVPQVKILEEDEIQHGHHESGQII